MESRRRNQIVRALAVLLAGAGLLGLTGCDKSGGPQEAAKAPANASPVAVMAPGQDKTEKSPPAQAAPSPDEALAARVKKALAMDPRLKSFGIDIRATNGVVELFGTVDVRANREKAAKVAAEVEGVGSVKNHLVLVSGS